MNLLTPGFAIAGLLLAGIPILIHILNRRRYREQRWAAMEFLLKAMKKNRRRLRFEQWILLAVRCLLLALLGVALARPIGCEQTAISQLARQSTLQVLILDNSYSMAYEADRPEARTHLDQAKRIAKAMISRMTAGGDSVAIITASAPAKLVFAPGYDLDAARAAIDRVDQSYASTDLPGALRLAAQTGRESTGTVGRELHLLSDATRSSLTSAEAALKDTARDAAGLFQHWTFHRLGLANQKHSAVTTLTPDAAVVTARQGQRFRADLQSFGDAAPREIQWKLDDQILPGGTLTATSTEVSQVKMARAGARIVSVQINGDDRLKLDQSRRRVVEVVDRVKVLIVEGERGSGPLGSSAAFLRLALAPPTPLQSADVRGAGAGSVGSTSIFEPDVISDLELGNKSLAEYRAVLLVGVPQIPEETARQLRAYVDAGGALVTFMGEGVSSENYNTTLAPKSLIPGPLVKRITVGGSSGGGSSSSGGGGKGATFDFNPQGNLHPMLAVLKNESRTGLDTAEVFTYYQVDLSNQATTQPTRAERVLDFTTTRDPAITTTPIGKGRAVFVATSAGADGWTTLPAKPVFVTLIQEMVGTSLSSRDGWMNLTVGSRLELPPWLGLASVPTLTEPGGATTAPGTGPLVSEAGSWHSAPLTKPGVYVLSGLTATAAQGASLPIAVNVDATAEADIRTLDEVSVSHALGDVPVEVVGDQLPADQLAGREHQGADYGWVVMLAVLGLLGAESLLAMRFGHSSR